MADGSGEDEKIASAPATEPADGHPVPRPVEPGSRAATTPPPAGPPSEWTVSDRRGPLNAARLPDDDVERFVPGSEIDAEGTHDSVISDHGPSVAAPASTVATHPTKASEPSVAATIDPEQPPVHAGAAHTGAEHTGTPAAAATKPRRSVVPLAIAVVLGAAIGAGSAALVYAQFAGRLGTAGQSADSGRLASLSARVDAIEKRPDPAPALARMRGQVDDLASKVATLDTRTTPSGQPPSASAPAAKATSSAAPAPSATTNTATQPQPAADTGALNAKIVALQSSVDALQRQTGSRDLAGKLEALQASLTGVQTLASSARTNVDALKSQQQAIDGKLGDLRNAVGDAQKQASAAKSGVDVLQGEQKSLAGKLGAPALAVVADSLVAQIASGKPYETQVDALASLGADPVKVALLRQNAPSGVPSSQALLAKFKPLVDPIVATGSTAPGNANFGQRLVHGVFGLVSVRRTDVTTGNDLSSKVALIQADLASNDVTSAYGVWDSLPGDAKQASAAWGASAKTSVEAVTAARGLQTQSIGSLAAKKS